MRGARARILFGLWLATAAGLPLAQEPPRAQDASRALAAQRVATLAERIAKLQAQLGLGVLAERSRRSLRDATRELESAAGGLAAGVPAGELQDAYLLLALLVQDYRLWAAKPPTRENARKLSERCEEIAWVAGKGARLAEERARTPGGTLALHATQAGMLAQRVARLHLVRRWGPRDDSPARELAAASTALEQVLERLGSASQNTPAIAAEVQVSQSQYTFLTRSAAELESGAPAARQLEFIAKTGDNITESMERAARLYEALAR